MIVYQLGPIDVWFGWTHLDDVLATASKPLDERIDLCPYSTTTLQNTLTRAQRLAEALGWDGDLREGPYFSRLPENDFYPGSFLLAWKQDNNGTTYIASPYRLPWLETDCIDWITETSEQPPRPWREARA